MSTDFENELRDLFREKAGQAPLATPSLPASAPRQVLRRGRIHQAGTILGAAAVVVALIVGSVAGLTRILGEGEDDRAGNGGYEIFERTATIEAFTLTSPSDWYLVNQWPLSMLIAVEGSGGSSSECVSVPSGEPVECENSSDEPSSTPLPVPYGLPMIQLSNIDLDLATNACETGLSSDAAVLYVALDYEGAIGGVADPSIQEFPPGSGLPPEGDGPCGPGRYAHFTVNGERFFAWIGVGSAVSDEDRQTVETSFEKMSAIPEWTPTSPDRTTAGYVIAGGISTAEGPWRLEVRPGNDVEVTLFVGGSSAADFDVALGSEPVAWCCTRKADLTSTDIVFGGVQKDATGVVFRTDDELAEIPGMVMPLPPTLPFDFDLFFLEGAAGLMGDVFALGVEAASPYASPSPSTRTEVVDLSGVHEGVAWSVRFSGTFDGRESPCIEVKAEGEEGHLCPDPLHSTLARSAPHLVGVHRPGVYLVVGSVPPVVEEIRFVGDDDAIVPQQSRCAIGPLGWTDPDKNVCVITLPPEGSGTLEYLDADGNVLYEDGLGWGSGTAEPEVPTPVDPVHGGTYWAVYPWVGGAGSPDAENMSALLLEDFGIEAFFGDLSCDDGAAEALGTDAEQAIRVYFETSDEANAFALQAGLLDHTRRVIARVTTYCLD